MHGLLSIPPKQTGLTLDSLLTGDTSLASPKLSSMGVMEPINCLKMLTRSAFESSQLLSATVLNDVCGAMSSIDHGGAKRDLAWYQVSQYIGIGTFGRNIASSFYITPKE